MGTPVRFWDLSSEARTLICNGCGPKGGWVPVPEFIFGDSCDHHDFNYWLGCDEFDRLRADWQFYGAMLAAADEASWWKRWWYRWMAGVYYRAVRAYGASSFYYGVAYRTLEDLEAALEAARPTP